MGRVPGAVLDSIPVARFFVRNLRDSGELKSLIPVSVMG
jgi:hypothetical protein